MTIDRTLELTFNHVVLPPKLSGEQDCKVEDIERELLSRLLCAIKTIGSCGEDDLPIWHNIVNTLQSCGPVDEKRYVNKVALTNVFHDLNSQHAVILRIAEQNAGLLIRFAK